MFSNCIKNNQKHFSLCFHICYLKIHSSIFFILYNFSHYLWRCIEIAFELQHIFMFFKSSLFCHLFFFSNLKKWMLIRFLSISFLQSQKRNSSFWKPRVCGHELPLPAFPLSKNIIERCFGGQNSQNSTIYIHMCVTLYQFMYNTSLFRINTDENTLFFNNFNLK